MGRLTTASRAAIRAETQLRVQAALNSMDPMDREVLVLRHFEMLSNEETARVLLRNRGVPDAAIRLLGRDLPSTVAEAAEAARTFGTSAGTLLVVTSRYHVYRARLIFAEALPATRVLVVASGAEPLPERWWTDQEAARNVPFELVKLACYRLGMSFK